MTLAMILVVAAALGLMLILRIAVARNLRIPADADLVGPICPLNLEAFRNLVDPLEDAYLRRGLPGSTYRLVRRARLHAMAAYVRTAGRNAAVLVRVGQNALTSGDAQTIEAARELVDEALLLRRNAAAALLRIYLALVWPSVGSAAMPVLDGYRELSSFAMRLGRLQNPAVPVRISAS